MTDGTVIISAIISVFPLFVTGIVACVAYKQLKLSRIANRDNRFAKAAEMLGNNESLASHSGALYMLWDLVEESPEKEYIRCVDVIANWLRGAKRDRYLVRVGTEIFTAKKIDTLPEETRKKIIKEHRRRYRLEHWPYFNGAKLQRASFKDVCLEQASFKKTDLRDASLAEANLEGAYLGGAKLWGACISDAKMEGADDLKSSQITDATWQYKKLDEEGKPLGKEPELPKKFCNNTKIKKWRQEPDFRYKFGDKRPSESKKFAKKPTKKTKSSN